MYSLFRNKTILNYNSEKKLYADKKKTADKIKQYSFEFNEKILYNPIPNTGLDRH